MENLVRNLSNNVQYSNSFYNDNLFVNEKSAYFTPISCKEIIDIIRCLKNGTSAGYDDINITVVKKFIHLFFFQFMFVNWYFPNQMKIAKVIPVLKVMTAIMYRITGLFLSSLFSLIFWKSVYISV